MSTRSWKISVWNFGTVTSESTCFDYLKAAALSDDLNMPSIQSVWKRLGINFAGPSLRNWRFNGWSRRALRIHAKRFPKSQRHPCKVVTSRECERSSRGMAVVRTASGSDRISQSTRIRRVSEPRAVATGSASQHSHEKRLHRL